MSKKTFTGIVASSKMQNTVVVEIERRFPHPMYKKIMKRKTRLKADTNNLTVAEGDKVKIEETRPASRDKHFKVIHIFKESP